MWKEIMILDGIIENTSKEKLDAKKAFKLLEENGYLFEGSFEVVKREELTDTIQRIDAYITEDLFQTMQDKLKAFYDELTDEEMETFFGSNFGTGVFEGLFEDILKGNEELKLLFKKYAKANWQISDTFQAELGEVFVKRLNVTKP